MDPLAAYYAGRAAEYELVYSKPERQGDLAHLRERVCGLLAGCRVLEIACGTGWWTEVIASEAAEVTAIDLSDEMLAIARGKLYPQGRVTFMRGDCHALPQFGRRHDALLGAFWWSHVPRARLDAFLAGAEQAIAPGGLLLFIDNRYVEGSSTPVARRDAFFSSDSVAFWWAAPSSLMRSWARSRPNLRSVMNCPLAFSMALLLTAGTPAWPTAPAPALTAPLLIPAGTPV